jgi:hypothetical protein
MQAAADLSEWVGQRPTSSRAEFTENEIVGHFFHKAASIHKLLCEDAFLDEMSVARTLLGDDR